MVLKQQKKSLSQQTWSEMLSGEAQYVWHMWYIYCTAAILFSAIVGDTSIVEGDIPFHWIRHPQIVLKCLVANFYSKMLIEVWFPQNPTSL